jgi:hypothetical protein
MSLDLLGSELILSGRGDRLKTVTDADLHRPIKGSISGIEELKVTINNAVRRHDKPRPWPGAKPAPQYSAMPVMPSVWHLRLEARCERYEPILVQIKETCGPLGINPITKE